MCCPLLLFVDARCLLCVVSCVLSFVGFVVCLYCSSVFGFGCCVAALSRCCLLCVLVFVAGV